MAKEGKLMAKIGVWAFIIGVVLALVGSFLKGYESIVIAALVLVGLIVGFLNVTEDETKDFLMASVAMMIALFTAGQAVATFTTLGSVGTYLINVLSNVNIFVFPATIVVAMKAIYNLAKDA
jgi:hypothetical protein